MPRAKIVLPSSLKHKYDLKFTHLMEDANGSQSTEISRFSEGKKFFLFTGRTLDSNSVRAGPSMIVAEATNQSIQDK